jgi:hypothetical protein
MGDQHLKEASWVVHGVSGTADYLAAINYDVETFQRETDAAVEYVKKASQG